MGKLSNVVKNDVKKTVSDKLVAKVDDIDTSDFVLKTNFNTDKSELENKIANATDFFKKAKLTESENKIPDISNLATKTTLTTKQTITLKLQKLKLNLIIMFMTNILILKSLIN